MRKRIRSAVAESSSSWSLGEYAVSIRSDFRSTASLPPRPQHAADATRRYPTLFRPLQPFASEVETEAGKVALYAVECAPEIGGEGMGVMQDDRRDVEPLREVSTATKTNARPFRPCRESSTQRSRKRVTFVMRPATPCPVPSKKRQRFNPHPPAEHPPLRPHHKGLPPTIMLSYLFAAEK